MQQPGIKTVLIYFAVFSLTFTFLVPPFEAPDENGHLGYLNFIQAHGTLPNQLDGNLKEPFQGHQPPLYYMLLYGVNYAFNSNSNFAITLIPNALHVWNGGAQQHVPYYLHSNDEVTPRGFFYLLRILSVLIGLVNIYFIYRTAFLIFENSSHALIAAFLAASLVQFAFISGVINNDNAANLLATLSLYYLIEAVKYGKAKSFITAGVCIGLGILTKKTILFIFLPLGAAFAMSMFGSNRSTNRTGVLKNYALCVITLLVIASPYFIRNITLYGAPLGLREELSTFGKLESHSVFSYYFIDPFSHEFFKSFVGYPGMMNVLLPKAIYIFYAVLFALGAAGIIFAYKKLVKTRSEWFIIVVAAVSAFAGVVYFNTLLTQFQGRLMFNALSAICALAAGGLISIYHRFQSIKFTRIMPYLLYIILIAADLLTLIVTYNFYHI